MSVSGSVIESTAAHNGSFGIIALAVRNCTALQNVGDGILPDSGGGLATWNVSSFNGGYGISVPYGTVTGNSVFLHKSSGTSALCPRNIFGNTIVAAVETIETRGTGCVLANNATHP